MGAHQRGIATPDHTRDPVGAAPTPDRAQLGRHGEQTADRYLRSRGCEILLRNYRCRMGELDLVARAPDGTLIIAEVRLRTRADYGGGAASVTLAKQRRIIRASRHLLAIRPQLARCAIRFDVLELSPGAEGYEVNWICHAFSCTA